MASDRWQESVLPLIQKKERIAKQKKALRNSSYLLFINNDKKRPLPELVDENGVVTPYGADLVDLAESFGFDCELVLDEDSV